MNKEAIKIVEDFTLACFEAGIRIFLELFYFSFSFSFFM